MNLMSFVDELLEVRALDGLLRKHAQEVQMQGDPPAGLMSPDPTPEEDNLNPADATTRLPRTAHLLSAVQTGHLGSVTEPLAPIDREKHKRPGQ